MDFILAMLVVTSCVAHNESAAPDSVEVTRFPSAEYAEFCSDFSARYQSNLEELRRYYGSCCPKWIDCAIAEAVALREVWDRLFLVHRMSQNWPDYHSLSMQKLRTMLGEQLWAEGRMPPPVPVWRFQLVD